MSFLLNGCYTKYEPFDSCFSTGLLNGNYPFRRGLSLGVVRGLHSKLYRPTRPALFKSLCSAFIIITGRNKLILVIVEQRGFYKPVLPHHIRQTQFHLHYKILQCIALSTFSKARFTTVFLLFNTTTKQERAVFMIS